MEAVKQVLKVPKNHEVKIKIPDYIPEDTPAEIIIIVNNEDTDRLKKLVLLKEAVKNHLFMEDFNNTDIEEWG